MLVAGSIVGHVHEERARIWLRAAREGRVAATASAHAFAEMWATLTAIPVEPRVAPSAAERIVDRLAQHVQPVALQWDAYRAALRRCADRHLRSGAVYDALHLCAAERSGAEAFLTFNTRDFAALAVAGGPRVVAPPDPPALFDGSG